MLSSMRKQLSAELSYKRFILLLVLLYFSDTISRVRAETIMRMIEHEHYPAERHYVQTQDGYIVSLYRIPRRSGPPNSRKVVLFMHGMTASAPAYLNFGKSKSAGYKFWDAGYDVWFGNARGTTYSRRHTTLNPDRPEFWDFSWHEIGLYDVPAMIDFILKTTGQRKLAYVGHSQGVTAAFVMLSELPEYNKKISILHAMTPPVVFKYPHPIYQLPSADVIYRSGEWLRTNGFHEIVPHTHLDTLNRTAEMCMSPFGGSEICKNVIFSLFGPTKEYYNKLFFDIINHIPSGASYKQFMHYGQIIATGRFQKYHYGTEKNMQIYGTPLPPEYNFSNILTKIHIMYGTNDWLIPAANIPILVDKLKPHVVAISKFDGFNHIDFTYARHLEIVHKKIFRVLQLFH